MVIQNRVYVKRDLPRVRIVRLHNRLSVAEIRGTAFVVQVRTPGDKSPTTNPPSTVLGQTLTVLVIWDDQDGTIND